MKHIIYTETEVACRPCSRIQDTIVYDSQTCVQYTYWIIMSRMRLKQLYINIATTIGYVHITDVAIMDINLHSIIVAIATS